MNYSSSDILIFSSGSPSGLDGYKKIEIMVSAAPCMSPEVYCMGCALHVTEGVLQGSRTMTPCIYPPGFLSLYQYSLTSFLHGSQYLPQPGVASL